MVSMSWKKGLAIGAVTVLLVVGGCWYFGVFEASAQTKAVDEGKQREKARDALEGAADKFIKGESKMDTPEKAKEVKELVGKIEKMCTEHLKIWTDSEMAQRALPSEKQVIQALEDKAKKLSEMLSKNSTETKSKKADAESENLLKKNRSK